MQDGEAMYSVCCENLWLARYTHDFGEPDKIGNLFKELNEDLRSMSTLTKEGSDKLKAVWDNFMATMMKALGKVPKMEGSTFYRGRPESWLAVREIYFSGRRVTWASFTSVTKELSQAAHMAGWNTGCVLELSLFDVLDISKFSFFPNEQEGILVPNTQLVVLGKAAARLIIHDTQKRLVKCIYLQQGGQGIQLIS